MCNTQDLDKNQDPAHQDVAPSAAPSTLHLALREKVAKAIDVSCNAEGVRPVYQDWRMWLPEADAAISATIEELADILHEAASDTGEKSLKAGSATMREAYEIASDKIEEVEKQIRSLLNNGGANG